MTAIRLHSRIRYWRNTLPATYNKNGMPDWAYNHLNLHFDSIAMYNPPDILTLAYKQAPMQEQMILLHEREQQMPGSVQYSIRRYQHNPQWNTDDVGMMVYHYEQTDPRKNYLELRFCVSGNIYCKQKDTECYLCKAGLSKDCAEKMSSV